MLKRMTGTLWAYVVILAFTGVIFYQSWQLHYFLSKIIPIIICLLVFLLTFWGIAIEARSIAKGIRMKAVAADEELGDIAKNPQKGLFKSIAIVIAFTVLILVVGFLVATPLFIIGYVKYNGGTLRTAILSAALMTLFVHVLFNIILKADLYHGKLFLLLGW